MNTTSTDEANNVYWHTQLSHSSSNSASHFIKRHRCRCHEYCLTSRRIRQPRQGCFKRLNTSRLRVGKWDSPYPVRRERDESVPESIRSVLFALATRCSRLPAQWRESRDRGIAPGTSHRPTAAAQRRVQFQCNACFAAGGSRVFGRTTPLSSPNQ